MNETKTDMMLNGICMVCENKDTLCTHIGQVKEECPFIQKAISTKITNADRIRSMTDYEMSTDLIPLIMEVCEDGVPCEELFLEWLQSEAE